MVKKALPCRGAFLLRAEEIAYVAKDVKVPVSETRDFIGAMKDASRTAGTRGFPDAAHDIWAEVMQTTELPKWLFASARRDANIVHPQ